MVRSQLPSIFLRISCSGPGLTGSWAGAGAASTAAATSAQNQRAVFIGTLPEKRATRLVGDAPRLSRLAASEPIGMLPHDARARPVEKPAKRGLGQCELDEGCNGPEAEVV